MTYRTLCLEEDRDETRLGTSTLGNGRLVQSVGVVPNVPERTRRKIGLFLFHKFVKKI